MPAGRTVIERTAGAIGTAVPAGSTSICDTDDHPVVGGGLAERRKRHRLRGGYRREAEAEHDSRSSKNFHGLSFLEAAMARVRNTTGDLERDSFMASRQRALVYCLSRPGEAANENRGPSVARAS